MELLGATIAGKQLVLVFDDSTAEFAGAFALIFVFFLVLLGGRLEETEIALAVRSSAETREERRFVDIEFVVEGEFHVGFDVFDRENPDGDFAQDVPFLRDAVGITGVVDKPSDVPLAGGIDDFLGRNSHQIGAGCISKFGQSSLSLVTLYRKNLSEILDNKRAGRDEFACFETPSFTAGLEGIDASILLELKLSVIAEVSAGT